MRETDESPDAIRFNFAVRKTREAICFLLKEAGGSLDVREILTSCYLADKRHLNMHGEPIFGAQYHAMPFGPMAIEVYETIKQEPLYFQVMPLPAAWELRGKSVFLEDGAAPNMRHLSLTNKECLRYGLARKELAHQPRAAETHGPDWQKAGLGPMKYADMIDDGPAKPKIVERLRRISSVFS